jgi:hypothetical protein
MSTQNYCMVDTETNVCDNICVWDGNTDTWTPPPGQLMLVQATTPAKLWDWNNEIQQWVLQEQVGGGGVGFTWDGVALTTNEPMPPPPVQPSVDGAQTL